MSTHVLLLDNNAPRSNTRRHNLAAVGVEVISAFEEQQAAEALMSGRVDVICIDSQFVANRGSGLGPLIERRAPAVPVVLIIDDAHIPSHLQKYADIVVDREDFATAGKRLMQQLDRGEVPFFQRWFCAWVNRASESRHVEAMATH